MFSVTINKTIQSMENELDQLFQQIGKLQVELDWLKKRLAISIEHSGEGRLG